MGWTTRARTGLAVVVSLVAMAGVAACTHSTTSTGISSPSGARCEVSVTNSLASAPAAGGSGTLDVTTDRDCPGAVSTDAGWVTILSGANGQGPGSATFRVAANTDTTDRRASIAINDRSLPVVQAAACRYTVSPTTIAAGAAGGVKEVRVDTGATCEWGASGTADWAPVRGGGRGPGTAMIDLAANSGGPRSAHVVVAGQSVAVNQDGVVVTPCRYALSTTSTTVGAAPGNGSVGISTTGTCAWTATSNAAWITIASGRTGTGNGTVAFRVDRNQQRSERSGTITVQADPAPGAGSAQTFVITQRGR